MIQKVIVVRYGAFSLGVVGSLGLEGLQIIALYYHNTDYGRVSKYVYESVRVPHPREEKKAPHCSAYIYIERRKIRDRDMRFDIVSVNLNTHETRIVKNAFEVDY